ncbi:MAG: energy-coupling factor transporter transmembrane protein EcfT [Anaerolineae bacterium]|nr:energy-coupling factor transporter transmembrane protein EcfT [Anaerolineae bacterium]
MKSAKLIGENQERFHPYTWLAWLAAAATPALLTRNPVYLTTLLFAVGLTYRMIARVHPENRGWSLFIRLGFFLWLFTIPFNALTVHAGNMVLFRLPTDWPIVGGPITLEAAAYGLANGLSLLTILVIFATFNLALDPGRLLRLVPAALYQAGVVTAIAITFVPQMMRSLQEIKEAQEVRGHRFRGLRDLLPIFVPLLTMALERAVQLAESMESRGFGGPQRRRNTAIQMMTLLLLMLLAAGLFAYNYWRHYRPEAGLAISVALGGLVGVFWAMGRQSTRTRYRRWLWQRHDTVVATVSAVSAAGVLLVRWVDHMAWIYYPYPPFGLQPDVRPWLMLLLLTPALPALITPRPRVRWPSWLAGLRNPRRAGERIAG